MDAGEAMRRWPQWRLDDDTRVMFQEASGIAAAARANAAHRRVAAELGATLVDDARVTSVREAGGEYELVAGGVTYRAERLIVTADAWTNEILEQLWRPINLTVTQEQVHYYASRDLEAFAPGAVPDLDLDGRSVVLRVPRVRRGGREDRPRRRRARGHRRHPLASSPIPRTRAVLDAFMQEHLPGGFGPYLRQRTCLYTMTPDRDFVIDLVPGHERAAVGQGAAHAFKFASVFGKSLVELVFDGKTESDVSDWTIDRDVLTMDDPPKQFMV